MNATGSTLLSILATAALGAVSGIGGAVFYSAHQTPPQQVMVVDMAQLLEPIAADPTLDEYEKRQITERFGDALNRTLDERARAGVIVLDASAVVRAPGDSYVEP